MPKLIRLPASILACSLATVVLTSTASATAAEGDPITPTQKKYVSNGEYGIRSDDFGSSTWLENNGEQGFRIIKSTAHGPKPGSTDDIEGWQPFSQVRRRLSLPRGCTYQVQPLTAPIRALTC